VKSILLLILLTRVVSGISSAQDSRYAADPLLLGAGARSLGMGSAFVAVSDDATALYWNAAGLAQLERAEIQAQHAEQFGGTVNHDFITVGIPADLGTFGIGLVRLGVNGIRLSSLEDPSLPLGPGNRPVASGKAGTSDYTLTVGYGRAIRNHLSVGATLKLIWRNLDAGNGTGYGLDLGVHYVHHDTWRMGAVIKDVTGTRITFDSGARDRIQPSLNVGVAYLRPLQTLDGQILLSMSAVINEATSGAEDGQTIRSGLEYRHQRGLAARLGLEGDHFTAGAGLEPTDRIRVDIAFLENGDLDNTYRISASLFF
jgi:hypothetical protein